MLKLELMYIYNNDFVLHIEETRKQTPVITIELQCSSPIKHNMLQFWSAYNSETSLYMVSWMKIYPGACKLCMMKIIQRIFFAKEQIKDQTDNPSNPCATAVHMERFSISTVRALISIFATVTKICTPNVRFVPHPQFRLPKLAHLEYNVIIIPFTSSKNSTPAIVRETSEGTSYQMLQLVC